MPSKLNIAIASVIGIDIGKNSFHVVGQDQRGAIVLRQKWSRGQVEARLAVLRLATGRLMPPAERPRPSTEYRWLWPIRQPRENGAARPVRGRRP
jgi:hypothetical protein